MAVGDRVDQFRALIREAFHDLFDQRKPFGRLALVQVLMLAGDTLVTISLAGSLFFSITPNAARDKVLLYLLLTIAPFAVVSPLLGPLIDKSRGARRAMVVFSAVGRCVLCLFMAMNTKGLLLFPLAFLILVLSKLYLVTRGALVPEMAAAGVIALPGRPGTPAAQAAADPRAPYAPTQTPTPAPSRYPPSRGQAPDAPLPAAQPAPVAQPIPTTEYAALNARLTLLGTFAGFVASAPGVFLLKVIGGAPAVLVFDMVVFAAAAVAGARLPIPRTRAKRRPSVATAQATPATAAGSATASGAAPAPVLARPSAHAASPIHPHGRHGPWRRHDTELAGLQPAAHSEVLFGLSAMSVVRALGGFLIFLLAFEFRRTHTGLEWYGLALGGTGVGAVVGLLLVAPLRRFLSEQNILLVALCLIALAALGAANLGNKQAQAGLALFVGLAGAIAQPSFTAIAQHFVPIPAQGRAFARFATRQQLAWVAGSLLPVIFALTFREGDIVMTVVAAIAAVAYVASRQTIRYRALPRSHAQPR